MADIITLTDYAVVTPSSIQPLSDAIDVGAYDELYLQVFIASLAYLGGIAIVTLNIETAMQRETADGWRLVGSVGAQSNNGDGGKTGTLLLQGGSFLRYVRYSVSTLQNADSATIWLAGVGRSYSKR